MGCGQTFVFHALHRIWLKSLPWGMHSAEVTLGFGYALPIL